MPQIPRQHVAEGLNTIERALVAAAGADKRLSEDDLERALQALPPTERHAVDAFVHALDDRERARGVITVGDIERAIRGARMRLAPMSGPSELDADALAAARTFGEGLVRLAERLAGAPADAVLALIEPETFADLEDAALLQALRERCAPHVQLSYASARDVMFSSLARHTNDVVHDVYTDRDVPAGVARQELERLHRINTEHTRPRSTGVEGTPANSDLHHLFPTDVEANSKRSSLPFGDVVDVIWESAGSRLGTDRDGTLVFEPPLEHRGNVARALFYIAAIYGLTLSAAEERTLRRWHMLDPVDDAERARNDAISVHQENRNPFIDDPGLVDRIDDF